MSKLANTELTTLKAKRNKAHKEALPFLMFLLGLVVSAFLSEFITVLHEIIKEKGGFDYKLYRMIILIVSPFILGYVFYFIRRDFMSPLDKLDKQIADIEEIV